NLHPDSLHMPQLFLVRHAEPALTGVLLGQCDPGLSDAGRGQALSLALDVRIVYTSPLRRAVETATLMARGAPIEIVDDLREITFGSWDGLTWAEIEAANPKLAAQKLADWQAVTPPGGEHWSNFASRIRRAFDRIASGIRPAAVVAHAGVMHVIA